MSVFHSPSQREFKTRQVFSLLSLSSVQVELDTCQGLCTEKCTHTHTLDVHVMHAQQGSTHFADTFTLLLFGGDGFIEKGNKRNPFGLTPESSPGLVFEGSPCNPNQKHVPLIPILF